MRPTGVGVMVSRVDDVPVLFEIGGVGEIDGVEMGFLYTGYVVYVRVEISEHMLPSVEGFSEVLLPDFYTFADGGISVVFVVH